QSRSQRISLPLTPNFLYQESDHDKERVENPNAHGSGLICQWVTRHVCITYLDDNEGDSKSDHYSFTNCGHRISRQVKHDSDAQQPDFQRKFGIPIMPQPKADFPRVVVDGEITRMRDEVQNPMRENSQAHDQSRVFRVEAAASAAEDFVTDSCRDAPKHRCDQAMRIRMEI